MRLNKRILALLLAAVMLLGLAACGTTPAQLDTTAPVTDVPTDAVPDTDETDAEAQAGWQAVTLTDQTGREVTIETQPEKIVSGYYITTSLLIALGCTDQVVGIEAKAASRNIYALAAPTMLDLPNVGSAKDFNLEACIAMEPDLVILPKKLSEPAETLSSMGIPVLLVNPESGEQLREAISLIGQAVGKTDRAQALLDFYDAQEAALADTLVGQDAPTVYLASSSDVLSTATAKMYQNQLISAAGGTNVGAELEDTYWATVSYEQLLAWNPDYIVLVPEASYTVEDVCADPQLAGLSAVQNGRVLQMPTSFEPWDSPVPSSILGTLWLGCALHPDVCDAAAMQKTVQDFYQEFYGFTADTEDLVIS